MEVGQNGDNTALAGKLANGDKKTRTRSCSNPSPKYKGKKCDGSGTETKNCNGKNLKITTCIYYLFHTFISHSISYTYS